MIDPAWDVPAVLDRAERERLRVTAAAVTHGHDDHTRGLEELVRATGAAVLVHHRDAHELGRVYGGPLTPVEHDYAWLLGDLEVRLLHTPGHTPGSQCILADGALFTGDTLMAGTLGRTGAQRDAAEAMWHTVSVVLAALPDDTLVYPGHDYGPRPVSTLAVERRVNPCLSAASFEDFQGCIAGI